MFDKPDCGQCKKIKSINGKKPRCEVCIPHLWPENEFPASVFFRVCNQHVMGFNGPIDLMIGVARAEIERYVSGIEDQDYCLDLVYSAYKKYLGRIASK
jgi:hypothetical protein